MAKQQQAKTRQFLHRSLHKLQIDKSSKLESIVGETLEEEAFNGYTDTELDISSNEEYQDTMTDTN
jgi:hypothetical protein